MNKKFMLLLPVLASLMLAGCGSTSSSKSDSSSSSTGDSSSSSLPAATITAVTVAAAGDATTVELGGTLKLTATVTGTGDFGKNVTWESSNKAVATVAAGLVTGVTEGEVTITATSKDDTTKKGTITLTVAKVLTPLADVLSLAKGAEYTARAVYMGQNNKTAIKDDVETYNSTYVAVGTQWYQLYNVAKSLIPADLVAGTSVLEFKGTVADYKKDDTAWTVKESTVSEMSVVTDATVTAGTWTTLTDAMTFAEADVNKGYSIENAVLVTKDVDATYGNMTITFKVGAGTSVYTMYLDSRYTDVTAEALAGVAVGDQFSCKTFGSQNAGAMQFIYALDFAKVANPIVIASADDANKVKVGNTLQLSATETGVEAATFVWSASPETVATVDATGLVTGVAVGEVTVTATANDGKSNAMVLSVYSAEPEPDYAVKTLKEVIDVTDAKLKQGFLMSGTVKAWKGTNADGTKYGNLTLTDGTNDVVVYGATATASALVWDEVTGVYAYTNPKDYLTNAFTSAIKIGDKLDVIAVRNDFNSTVQVSIIIRAINGIVIANAAEMTTDEVQAVENEAFHAYLVKGKITAWKGTNTDGSKYGNMSIKSEGATGEALVVYGVTATETALGILATGALKLTNPTDYLTNPATKDLAIGNEITMVAYRCDFGTTIEICGYLYLTAAVESVTLSGETGVDANKSITLTATIAPVTAPQGVAWDSSDETAATVDDFGEVTGVAAGKSTITATSLHDSTKLGTFEVTVTAPNPLLRTLTSTVTTTTNMADLTTAGTLVTSLGLSADEFSVAYAKGAAGSDCAVRNDGAIRMYANKASAADTAAIGNSVTVTALNSKTIATIEIAFESGYDSCARIYAGDSTTAVTATDGVYTINAASFKIVDENSSTTKTNQVRFTAIDIIFAA